MEDMILCALEPHLLVECLQFFVFQLGDVGLAENNEILTNGFLGLRVATQ